MDNKENEREKRGIGKDSKTIYIDQNKSLYVIICNCGHINKYNKVITDELCHCGKCGVKINPQERGITKHNSEGMNTKEAIKKVKSCHDCLYTWEKKNIVSLLKRGEKYKQMWKYLKNYFPYLRSELEVNEFTEKLEQKYFPKEE